MIFLRLFFGFLLQVIPFAFLCFQPFVKQYRYSRKMTAVITISLCLGLGLTFALGSCGLNALLPHTQQLFNAVNVIFAVALMPCFVWYIWAVTAPWQKKLFVFSYTVTGALIITSLNNVVITRVYLGTTDGLPYQGLTIPVLFLLTAVLLPVLSWILRRYYQPIEESFRQKENVYLSILAILLFCVMYSGFTYIDYTELYNPMALFLYAALLIAIFILYAIFFRLLGIAHEKLMAQQKYDEAQRQLVVQESQYRRLTDNIEITRRMRHDLRHHMITIQGLLKSGDTQQTKQYLSQILQITEEHEIAKLCGNAVVNLVVSHYQALAKEQDIPFAVRIAIPDELSILDADLSVLLGNLLENAVYAAGQSGERERFIHLNMICSGKMLAVTVDNSFSGTVKLDGGHYLSTKENHIGYGLQSVEAIAEKYAGGVEFTHESGEFHSSVMLGS